VSRRLRQFAQALLLHNGGGNAAPAASSLLTSLVAYWKLDEATGTRVDSTSRGNDLAPQHTPTNAAGKQGNALSVSRAGAQWCSIADNADLSMGDIDFSIAAWVYFNNAAPGGDFPSQFGASGLGRQKSMYCTTMSQPRSLALRSAATVRRLLAIEATTPANPSLSTWYFIVCWHDATANTINIRVNDTTTYSASHSAGCFNGTSAFGIGNGFGDESYANGFWDGRIDEVGIWKKVLTSGEITTLYNGGSAVTHPFEVIVPFNDSGTPTFSDDFATLDTAKWNTVSPFTAGNGWLTTNGAGGPNADELEAVVSQARLP
jgi:hypothetical protein